MAKKELPEIELDVSPSATDERPEVGDIYDELYGASPPRPRPKKRPQRPEPEDPPSPQKEAAAGDAPVASTPEPEQVLAPQPAPAAKKVTKPTRAHRKDVYFGFEAAEQLKDLVVQHNRKSSQGDIRHSEIVRGLVHILSDARNLIEYDEIRPRGNWGSREEKEYSHHLAELYLRAIVKHARKQYGDRFGK